MNILAFSDFHRDQAAARRIVDSSAPADVIVGAGDFATISEGVLDTLDILAKCSAPLILVHGNHDDPIELAQACRDRDIHYLHGTSVEIDGQVFFGLGGEIPSRNSHVWNASETEAAAQTMLESCPNGAVLVTHTPPFGIADVQLDGTFEGSAAIREAVDLYTPKLVLCGHIHNAWGMQGRVGVTRVHNLGPTVNWFEV